MRLLFTGLFLLAFLNSEAQQSQIEFSLLFGNDFSGDLVSVKLNGLDVAKNRKLKPTMISPESLVITQNSESLTVKLVTDTAQILNKIPIVASKLNVHLSLNGKNFYYSLNLKKGKFLIVHYALYRLGWLKWKVPKISQEDKIILI